MKIGRLAASIMVASGVALGATGAMAQSGGNGNGGSGGAATAGPTAGGDNTLTPGSTRNAPHFKHKKKAKPADTAQ